MTPRKVKITDRNTPCSIDFFTPFGIAKKKREWIKKHELYEATINQYKRVVTPVYISEGLGDTPEEKQKNRVIYMMDVVTGSLYDVKTGRCQTSSDLHMKGYITKAGLDKRLLKMKSVEQR